MGNQNMKFVAMITRSTGGEGRHSISKVAPDSKVMRHPCWLLPIKAAIEVLGRPGPLPSHEQLQAEGLLVEWRRGMRFIFFSHTWLSRNHPDPSGVKKQLIHDLCVGIVKGSAYVRPYFVAAITGSEKGFAGKQLQDGFKDGYLWLDYMRYLKNLRPTHKAP